MKNEDKIVFCTHVCTHSEGLVSAWKPPITWKLPKELLYLPKDKQIVLIYTQP